MSEYFAAHGFPNVVVDVRVHEWRLGRVRRRSNSLQYPD
jgi:hypothetical protein